MIVSLDSNYTAQASVRVPNELHRSMPIHITDLITGNSYIWDKEWNFVELTPDLPFHLFKIHKK